MTRGRSEDQPTLSDFGVPRPPEDLRERVLRAARAARPDDFWTRLWNSRAVRLAWTTSVLALVVAHGLVTVRDRRPSPGGTGSMASARRLDGEVAEITRLPRLRLDSGSRLGSSADGKAPATSEASDDKENS